MTKQEERESTREKVRGEMKERASIFLTAEDIDKLALEIGVWYDLIFDGTTVSVYRAGQFIKDVVVRPAEGSRYAGK